MDKSNRLAHKKPDTAHLIRDFTRIAQRTGKAGRIGHRLLGLGLVMFRWHHENVSAEQFARLQRRVRNALERGASAACKKTANTCAQLLKIWPALWTFVQNRQVPPTNNAAEQAIRPLVLKRKISGPTRSRRGDAFIARAYTVIESCRRQGRDARAFMLDAIIAWIDKTAPPSLLPRSAAG